MLDTVANFKGFSNNQNAFITAFAIDSGLDPRVVAAWVASEQPIGNDYPVGHRDQNWLNIGLTDNKWYQQENWGTATVAGVKSSRWMKGEYSVKGFGRSAPSIRAIAKTAGKSAEEQIAAIQRSGWASSGYGGRLGDVYNRIERDGGSIPIIGPAISGVKDAAGAVGDVGAVFAKFFTLLTSKEFWLMAGKIIAGTALVLLGLSRITNIGSAAAFTGRFAKAKAKANGPTPKNSLAVGRVREALYLTYE